jgi:hypothetical protein
MNNRNVVAFVLAVCGPLVVASSLPAEDPRPSHKPTSAEQPNMDGLAARLQSARDLAAIRSLAKQILKDPQKFEQLAKNKDLLNKLLKDRDTSELLKDPQLQQMFRDALKNQKLTDEQLQKLRDLASADKIDPKDLEKLARQVSDNPNDFPLDDGQRRQLQQIADDMRQGKPLSDQAKVDLARILNDVRKNPNVKPEDIEALRRLLDDKVKPPDPIDPGVQARQMPPDNPINPMPQPNPPQPPKEDLPPPTPKQSDSPSHDVAGQAMLKLADLLDDLDVDDQFVDSAANFLRNLANGDGDDKWLRDAVEKAVELITETEIGEWLPSDSPKAVGSLFDKLSGTSMPQMSGPSIPSVPSTSMLDNAEDLGRVLMWGLVLLACGLAAWKVASWYRDSARQRRFADGWPVPPSGVRTRGDLVRAFEYLALWCLGVDARHRNHIDLAGRLGDAGQSDDTRRRAANNLAHIYELARYAPEDELLTEAEMAAARQDLSYLAGAAAA